MVFEAAERGARAVVYSPHTTRLADKQYKQAILRRGIYLTISCQAGWGPRPIRHGSDWFMIGRGKVYATAKRFGPPRSAPPRHGLSVRPIHNGV